MRSRDVEKQRRVFALLAETGALEGKARQALLDASDPDLAAEVRELLAADAAEDDLLSTTVFGGGPMGSSDDGFMLAAGRRVGPYRILEPLGAGGMGQVYLAEQEEPVRRRVALKLLHLMPVPDTRRRLVSERRAMERLDHPNIGAILDAGTTADGLPYLVMEHIEGERITRFCRRHRLGPDARLRLFVDVCRAVEHAHRRFLLHRDIKASNVLVTRIDGRPVPKLIDFGIAKLLDDDAGARTATGFVGTPVYMSPEALAGAADLDTRSDVFSLGVLLFRLLTGRLPWTGGGATLATLLEERSRGEAEKPSTVARRLAESKHDGSDKADTAATPTPPISPRRLRGDLDRIVLRALALDPDERYDSAAALADDVERHLADEPIRARPPSAAYRLRKAYRRHRTAFVASALVVLALVLGSLGTSLGLLRARDAEEEARTRAAEAEAAREEAEEVVDFLVGLFDRAGPQARGTERPPSEMTALELLERSADGVAERLEDRPRVRARVEWVLGEVYQELAQWESADRHLGNALRLFESLPRPDPLILARVLRDHAQVDMALSRVEEGEARLLRARELARTAETSGLLLAHLEMGLSRIYRRSGELERAESHLLRALELYRALPTTNHDHMTVALANLGSLYFSQKRWSDAEDAFRRALEAADAAGDSAPGSRRVQLGDNLAAAVASQGRLDEAAPLFERALEERRRLLGDDHPDLGNSLNNLGVLHLDLGNVGTSAEYHRQALDLRRRRLGEDHPRTAWSHDNLARTLQELDDAAAARRHQERALAIRRAHYGEGHLDVARSHAHLARLAEARTDLDSARRHYERSLAIRRAALPPDHEWTGENAVRLGIVLWRLGERDVAERRIAEGMEILAAGGDTSAEELAEMEERLAAAGIPEPIR